MILKIVRDFGNNAEEFPATSKSIQYYCGNQIILNTPKEAKNDIQILVMNVDENNNEKSRYVIPDIGSCSEVFLMNDEGKTVERIR